MYSAVAWATGFFEPSRAGRSAASSLRRSKRPVIRRVRSGHARDRRRPSASSSVGLPTVHDAVLVLARISSRRAPRPHITFSQSSSRPPPFGLPDTQLFDVRAERPGLLLDRSLKFFRLLAYPLDLHEQVSGITRGERPFLRWPGHCWRSSLHGWRHTERPMDAVEIGLILALRDEVSHFPATDDHSGHPATRRRDSPSSFPLHPL